MWASAHCIANQFYTLKTLRSLEHLCVQELNCHCQTEKFFHTITLYTRLRNPKPLLLLFSLLIYHIFAHGFSCLYAFCYAVLPCFLYLLTFFLSQSKCWWFSNAALTELTSMSIIFGNIRIISILKNTQYKYFYRKSNTLIAILENKMKAYEDFISRSGFEIVPQFKTVIWWCLFNQSWHSI